MGGTTRETGNHSGEENTRQKGRFEVPYNWSDRFLDFILDNREEIDSVYGSLNGEPTGRPIPHPLEQSDLPDEKKMKTVIDSLRNAGIEFNLIMNASCTGNTLFTEAGKARLERKVGTLRDLGVERITVANFDLARRISALDPNIAIIMSVILNITEPDQLMYLRKQDFNFRGLVVGKGLNRNLPKLERFLQLAGDLKTFIIANDFCPVPNCPERITDHNNTCAHKHLPFDERLGEQRYIPPSLHCRKLVTEDTSLHLKAPVINPNDMQLYESIGAKLFKLTDRVMPDDVLMAVCEAYFNRKFDGNLFDLFSYTSRYGGDGENPHLLKPDELAKIMEKGYMAILKAKGQFLTKPHLDAGAISKSGFMKIFERGICDNNCFDALHNQDGCTHCGDFSARFLGIDEEVGAICHANVEAVIKASRERMETECEPEGVGQLQTGVVDWGEKNPLREAHIRDTHEILRKSQEEHGEKYMIEVGGRPFLVYPGVFPPSYFNDTEFFSENLPIDEGDELLEIGPGTGVIAIRALQRGAVKAVGIDINPQAVANSRENANLHDMVERTMFIEGDVYSPLDEKEKFDKIFWNVPFGYVTVPLTILEKSVFDTDYAAIERFIKNAKVHLKDKGKLLIGTSSVMGDFEKIKGFIAAADAVSVKMIAQKLQSDGRKQPLTFEIFEVTFR